MARGARGRDLWFLLIVPVLLLGPILAMGRLFLPQVAPALEPFRSEAPERALEAELGRNVLQSDRLFPFLTDQIATRASLADGALPLWEPDLGLGVPLFAQSAAGIAYPPNLLAVLLPPERAAGPLALLGLFLAGLGCWSFLGRRGLAPGARVIGSLAYQLGGWGVANLYYYMKFDAALWLPWALWAVEGLAQRKRWSGAWLVVAVAASLLAGMVQIGLLVAALTALYALLRLTPLAGPLGLSREEGTTTDRVPSLPPLLGAGVFLVLGGLAASVLLLPMLESSRQSARRLADTSSVEAMSLPVPTLLGVVVCDLFGTPTAETPAGSLPAAWWLTPAGEGVKAETANPLEWNTFVGLVAFLLALVGLVARPRAALGPVLLLLLVVGFAQGWPLVRGLYSLPGLNVGAPGRALAAAWFLWPWLAALGTDALIRRAPRAQAALVGLAFTACALAFVSWSTFDPERWALGVEDVVIERYAEASTRAEVRARLPFEESVAVGEQLGASLGVTLGAALAALVAGTLGLLVARPRAVFAAGTSRRVLVLGLGLALVVAAVPASARAFATEGAPPPFLLAVLGVGALALVSRRTRLSQDSALWLPLAAALLVEGLMASQGHTGGRPAGDGIFPASAGIEAIAEAAGDGRVIRYDTSPTGVADVLDLARPNMLQPYGIADATPWIVFPPRTFIELFEALDPRTRYAQGVSRLPDVALLGHPILDLARITAVVSREPLVHERLEPVLERPGFHVYHRTGALGPARLVARVLRATSDRIALTSLGSATLDPREWTVLPPEHLDLDGTDPAPGAPGVIQRFERPTRNRIEIDVAGSGGAWLVVHEQHDRGWMVTVNGESAELLRADHAFLAVRVPAGDSVIELRYAPGSLRLGLFLSLGALAAAVLASRRLGM